MAGISIKGLDEVLKKAELLQNDDFVSSLVRQSASIALADMIGRVADEGLAADGTKIGKYSTEPIYVSGTATPPPKAPLNGKYEQSEFANGKPHKSKYYAQGYSQYKTDTGRNLLGSVNLSLTRNMLTDFSLNNNFSDAPIKTSRGWGLGFRQSDNKKKLDGNEKRFNKAILSGITSNEEQHIEDFLNDYISDLFK